MQSCSITYNRASKRLFSRGINFDKLPAWQKRGIGIWKEQYEKEGFNPITQEAEKAIRNRIHIEYELPLGQEYADLVVSFIK